LAFDSCIRLRMRYKLPATTLSVKWCFLL
jgi:hypothetical protein